MFVSLSSPFFVLLLHIFFVYYLDLIQQACLRTTSSMILWESPVTPMNPISESNIVRYVISSFELESVVL